MPKELQLVLAFAGIFLCMTRVWWMWWTSTCWSCGHQHRACECGGDPHLMKRRR